MKTLFLDILLCVYIVPPETIKGSLVVSLDKKSIPISSRLGPTCTSKLIMKAANRDS